jgi:xanthine dehydrogenase/oxidase
VYTVGQIIGVMLAETKAQAQAAARAVQVTYDELPYILTIDEAIAADSFFPPRPKLHRGDITKMEEESDHILEGTWRMGGQEQFYFETQAALVIPHKEDNETEVWTSTQNPSETQVFVASALGIPQNRVVVRTKRIGGGFGGKESRSINLAAVMAVAARKAKRPVRSMLDRDEDMITSGQRHPFMATYRIGFKNDGKIVGLDAKIYNNGGWSQDLSQAVLERAMTHSDGCYWIPNFRIEGKIAKTNTMSNSAFRGFGGPQVSRHLRSERTTTDHVLSSGHPVQRNAHVDGRRKARHASRASPGTQHV